MPLREFLTGTAFFLPTLAASVLAAVFVARRRFSHLRGIESLLALGLFVTLAMLASHVVPLALGILTRGTALAASVLLAAGAWRLPAGAPQEPLSEPDTPPSGSASIALALLSVGAVAIYELARLRADAVNPFTHIDVLSFHLPGVARWLASGSLWQIDQLFPYNVTGNYPNNGDVLTLTTVLPWHDAAFARFLYVPFLVLTWLGIYATARRLRSPTATAALAASLVIAVPATSIYAQEGLPDIIVLFGVASCVLFLARHRVSGLSSDLMLAGLSLGLAFGTKWYGLTVAVAVLGAWAFVSLVERRQVATVLRQGAMLVGLTLLVGGIWLLRNLVESGNPIFPQKVGIGGLTLFPGTHGTAVDRTGFTVLGYLGNGTVVRDYVLPGLRAQLGIGWYVIAAGVVASMAVALREIRRRTAASRWAFTLLALALMSVVSAFFWMITPGSAPGFENHPQVFITVRWLVPSALFGLVAIAAATGALGRWAIAADLLLGLAVASALRKDPTVTTGQVAQAIAALIVFGALVWAGRKLAARLHTMPRPRRSVALGIGAAALCLALVVAGRVDQTRFDRFGYSSFDPTFAWIDTHAPSGARVGLAGEASLDGLSPILPAFGPRLRNQVEYVGPWVHGLLREYKTRSGFVRAVRRGQFDLLLVGRGVVPRAHVKEQSWARAAGYHEVAISRRLALYEAPHA